MKLSVHSLMEDLRMLGISQKNLEECGVSLSRRIPPQVLVDRLIEADVLTPFQAKSIRNQNSEKLLVRDYLILDQLGSGGMGDVYLALHRSMDRKVALKLLPSQFAQTEEYIERFKREIKTLAKFTHPQIVVAHDAGEYAGGMYLVMEHVGGRTLQDIVTRKGVLKVSSSCRFLGQVAEGLTAAHGVGIIHRDIKPSNLMLTLDAKLPVGSSVEEDVLGEPWIQGACEPIIKILDLGLAKWSASLQQESDHQGSDLTQSGEIVGTIDYMAPEQTGMTIPVDHRTDLYSLGCTLHFLLSGHPVFDAGSRLDRLIAHREQVPPSLVERRSDVPRQLEELYQQLLSKDPNDRPSTSREVAERLAAFDSTTDCPSSIFLSSLNEPTCIRKTDGNAASLRLGDHSSSTRSFRKESSQGSGEDSKKSEVLEHSETRSVIDAETAIVSPDEHSKRADNPFEFLEQKSCHQKSAPSVNRKRTIAKQSPFPRMRWWMIALGILLLCAVFYIKTNNGQIRITLDHPDAEVTVKLNGVTINTPELKTPIRVRSGKQELIVEGKNFLTYTKKFQLGRKERRTVLVELIPRSASKPIQQTNQKSISSRRSEVSRDNRDHETSLNRQQISFVSPSPVVLKGHRKGVEDLVFSPSENLLASAGVDQTVILWDVATASQRAVLNGNRGEVWTVDFSPDGRTLASSGKGRLIDLWKVPTADEKTVRESEIIGKHSAAVMSLSFSPDGTRIASGSGEEKIQIWDVQKRELSETITGGEEGDWMDILKYSPKGEYLVSAGGDAVVKFWNLKTKQSLQWKGHKKGVEALGFSPQGNQLVTADLKGTVMIWELPVGRRVLDFKAHSQEIWHVDWSPNGKWIATASADGTAKIWESQTGTLLRTLDDYPTEVNCLAFSHDGKYLAIAGDRGTILLWEIQ